jgi:hypothetical protein
MKRSLMGSFRRLIGSSSLAVALVAMLPAAAQAAGPIHTNFSFTILNDSICGISVTTSGTGVDNFTPVFDSTGNLVSYVDTGQYHITFTAANGRSVDLSAAGLVTLKVTTNPDGTFTITNTLKGLPERISSPQGAILTRDAGIITFTDTFDSSRTLISETITQSGPHPEADSAGALFCQVVTAALT